MALHNHRSLTALAACTLCMSDDAGEILGNEAVPTSWSPPGLDADLAAALVQARHTHWWVRNRLGYDECRDCHVLREDATAPDGTVL
jgi:hypothetical protein